jgi:hypothetical protein
LCRLPASWLPNSSAIAPTSLPASCFLLHRPLVVGLLPRSGIARRLPKIRKRHRLESWHLRLS